MSSTCRSCGAPVRFATSPAGKTMILDVEPTENGNVVLFLDEREYKANAVVFKNAEAAEAKFPGRRRYLDHHVTCPDAKKWRK